MIARTYSRKKIKEKVKTPSLRRRLIFQNYLKNAKLYDIMNEKI